MTPTLEQVRANLATVCDHVPGMENRWCERPGCGALILAGALLTGACSTERMFPPGFTWSPRSWCPACDITHEFGHPGEGPHPDRERPTSPYWRGEFRTQEHRPCSVAELGLALAWPNVSEMHRRLGTIDRVYWYRWRVTGIDVYTADRLAANACLHPSEVWGDTWERAA